MPVVEVDIETGLVSFLDYAVVHDCGTMLNPPAVRGQILGGICQGIGSALYEEFVYDESGTPLNGSFATYLMPTFAEMPRVRIEHLVTPSPFTYKGMKGTGGRRPHRCARRHRVGNRGRPGAPRRGGRPGTHDCGEAARAHQGSQAADRRG